MMYSMRKGNIKIALGLGLLLLIILGSFAYYEYSLLQQMDVQLTKTTVKDLSFSGATLGLTLAITNPSLITLTVNKLHLELYSKDIHIADINSDETLVLASEQTVTPEFSLQVRFKDLGQSIVSAFMSGSLEWQIKGLADIALPLGFTYQYPFEIENPPATSA